MRRMIRWLSKVGDSSQYEALRRPPKGRRPPQQGHVPVCVGEEMEWFEIRAELLGRSPFLELLRLSAEEYGYEQRGVLRIPCPVPLFRRLLAAAPSSAAGQVAAQELLLSFDELFLDSSDGRPS
ncbi:auxin-responsive protein SAUR71-like [Canna indica]|uniref:Auxin-responsive protein SAUR71-like n=1 Tax=Canna indica TaxID=4628 RepID=A0AAQ3KI05_9LILI|nr:auxin-responsive protein SAUR71-like [Canna indica]